MSKVVGLPLAVMAKSDLTNGRKMEQMIGIQNYLISATGILRRTPST